MSTLGRLLRGMTAANLIITPRYNQWVVQHGDDPLEPWVAEIVLRLLTTPPRFRPGSFSASSAGECFRKQLFDFLGIDAFGMIDPQLATIFIDGKWRHLRMQANLLQAGIIQDVEFGLDWPRMRSKGSVDGVGIVPDDHPHPPWRGKEFGLEIKGINPHQFVQYKDNFTKEAHKAQFSRYFLSGGFDLFVIIYENKATQEWFEWVVEPDPVAVSGSRTELKVLNRSVDNERLPKRLHDCEQRKGPVFKGCPYGGKNGVCVASDRWVNPKLIHPAVALEHSL